MSAFITNLDDALAAGFKPDWIKADLKLGDTVRLTRITGIKREGLRIRWPEPETVWINLTTSAEIAKYRTLFDDMISETQQCLDKMLQTMKP